VSVIRPLTNIPTLETLKYCEFSLNPLWNRTFVL
jgi:hypothetical protein